MNKAKRLWLGFRHHLLRMYRFFGNDFYKRKSYKYFCSVGIDFPNGKPKYINYDVDFDLLAPQKIHIGFNSVIAKGTIVLVHDYSIECGLVSIGKANPEYEVQFLKDVSIGDNCFIGARCFLLPGTKIGNNCIVGAGSVVRGVIPDNSIVCGNPARVICKTTEWAQKKYEQKDFVSGTKNKKN